MGDSLARIYHDYRSGKVTARELMVRLSAWESTRRDEVARFHRNHRLKRTIVTEIGRYISLAGPARKYQIRELAQRYLKDYLDHFVVSNAPALERPFSEYVKDLVRRYPVPREQFEQMRHKGHFWKTVKLIESEIDRRAERIGRVGQPPACHDAQADQA